MFPRSLIERKSNSRAAVSKPCAPNAKNAAAIKEKYPTRSSVFNRNLNGPTLFSGIVDPAGSLFADKLHRQGEVVRATRIAATSLMESRPLLDNMVVFKNAAQMLASTSRKEFISNTILLPELMRGAHKRGLLLTPPPARIFLQVRPQRPYMPIPTTCPLPDTALLDFFLQGCL
jgi:hypothetical protein